METEITILLDEFYENDTVVVSVDSVEVYNKHNVTTKLTISLADEFKVNATSEQVTIAVKVPKRNARQVETVNVEGEEPKITISVHNGIIEIKSNPMAAYL